MTRLFFAMARRYHAPGGYREVLAIGLPLVVSMGSVTLMLFADRLFLAHHDVAALAAAVPAGLTAFFITAFFLGVAEYTNVFVAQYTGGGRPERVGASLWQGVYFCLLAWLALALLSGVAGPLFALAGHAPELRALEEAYFRILMLGGGFLVLQGCLACFYSGRGLTRPVMLVNLAGAVLNIPLNYCLIFGLGPVPSLGVRGAALATVAAWAFMCLLYGLIVFREGNETRFGVRSRWRPDPELFGRLMRYGLPGGVSFSLDMFAIVFFLFMVGRLGEAPLAASNIAFNLNTVYFLPMIGMHIAVNTLVGQAVGAGRTDLAHQAVVSALHMVWSYCALCGVLVVVFAEPLAALHLAADLPPAEYAELMDLTVTLLAFVALYSLVEGVEIVYMGAVKGAGDTWWVMKALVVMSLFGMAAPVYVMVAVFGLGIVPVWGLLTAYIGGLALMAFLRYRGGAWKTMSVMRADERGGARSCVEACKDEGLVN